MMDDCDKNINLSELSGMVSRHDAVSHSALAVNKHIMYTVYGAQDKLIAWVSAVIFGPNYTLVGGHTSIISV